MTIVQEVISQMSFNLNIETNMVPMKRHGLMNRFEYEGSKVINITSCLEYFDSDNECFEDDTRIKDLVAFNGTEITLVDLKTSCEKTFMNENGFLTAKELMNVIIEFEKVNRNHTEWFGGIDTHHIFFEGLKYDNLGRYYIHWGS